MGLNKFMDLTKEEFSSKFLSPKHKIFNQRKYLNKIKKTKNLNKIISERVFLKKEFKLKEIDWRKKNAISEVKDQSNCGSCWAFSATGALESLYYIKKGEMKLFSEQQLIDCSGSYGNNGCNGGNQQNSFEYIIKNGISLEENYIYKAEDNQCMDYTEAWRISDYSIINEGDCNELANELSNQPIAIAVNADNWQFYSEGVYDDCTNDLDHGVLLVGYNSDYWTVKNSWGEDWGEKGFIKLAPGNTCGLADMASFPIY